MAIQRITIIEERLSLLPAEKRTTFEWDDAESSHSGEAERYICVLLAMNCNFSVRTSEMTDMYTRRNNIVSSMLTF